MEQESICMGHITPHIRVFLLTKGFVGALLCVYLFFVCSVFIGPLVLKVRTAWWCSLLCLPIMWTDFGNFDYLRGQRPSAFFVVRSLSPSQRVFLFIISWSRLLLNGDDDHDGGNECDEHQ